MAFVNFATREITAKIVYYGPGLGGKTTSLQYIHSSLSPENRGKMISLATEEDRTIYFDFLPLNLGKIQDFAVRVQLYTVPGQVRYNATRKLVLRGADGLVFVADSQKHKKLANLESFNNMEENLRELSKDLRELPHVLQFNKADLPGIMNAEELNLILNKFNVPFFDTVATTGIGVLDALKSITKLVFNDLSKKALLQKKKTGTTTGAPAAEYTMGSSFVQQAAPAAVMPKMPTPPPQPPPMPEPPAPPPATDYYGGKFDMSEEVVHEDLVDKMEDSYDIQDPYTELELEEEPIVSSYSGAHDNLQEVEPIAEFDDSGLPEDSPVLEFEEEESTVEPEFDITPEEPPVSTFKVPAKSFEPTLAPEIEPAVEKPAPRQEEPLRVEPIVEHEEAGRRGAEAAFSYGGLFEGAGKFSELMRNLELQISERSHAAALNTARDAYRILMEEEYPKQYTLDGSESSRIFALDLKFKRFARFKYLLNSPPDAVSLLYIHHFLSELYLSLKEL